MPHAQVTLPVTIFFATILILMILALSLEEQLHAKKSIVVGVFAVVSLLLAHFFHLLPMGALINVFNESLHIPIFIAAVDWPVITIILGSGLFVDVISKSGLFSWIAIKLTKVSRGDPLILFILYGVMTVLFSAILNNVTAMIIVGSLTGVSLKKLKQSDKLLGFLFTQGLLTNIGGLLTLISSVPNIIVGSAAKISFMKFLFISAPYVVLATALTLFLGKKIFSISRVIGEKEQSEARLLVDSFDENDGVTSKSFFWFGVIMTSLFVITIASTSVIPYVKDLGMGYVALSFAAIALLRFKHEVNKFYQAVDWDLIGFFMALFVVINVMEHAQVLALIGEALKPLLGLHEKLSAPLLLFGASLFSSVTDNIPLAAMLAKILTGLNLTTDSPLWWPVVFGANLGGNLTPIGSASTLVAVTIIHKNKIPLSFVKFVKMALPFAILQLVLAALYVLIL